MRSLLSVLPALVLVGCATTPDDAVPSTERAAASPDVTTTPPPDRCAELAAELTGLLGVAQRCHVAAANPIQCASWVPSIDGCSQPVAYPGSDAVKAYLAVYEQYAAACPLPDRPCLDPSLLAVDCTQGADADAAFGRCTILGH